MSHILLNNHMLLFDSQKKDSICYPCKLMWRVILKHRPTMESSLVKSILQFITTAERTNEGMGKENVGKRGLKPSAASEKRNLWRQKKYNCFLHRTENQVDCIVSEPRGSSDLKLNKVYFEVPHSLCRLSFHIYYSDRIKLHQCSLYWHPHTYTQKHNARQ